MQSQSLKSPGRMSHRVDGRFSHAKHRLDLEGVEVRCPGGGVGEGLAPGKRAVRGMGGGFLPEAGPLSHRE